MDREEWIAGLKVGSKVLINYKGEESIGVIDRETKTQWGTGDLKWRKKDGLSVPPTGSFFNPSSINPPE